MRIVTAGASYLDIDAYAGCVAYAELLQLQGQTAQAVSTAPLNESINRTIRSWQAPLSRHYTPSSDDTFTLIDVSDPEHFDKFVNLAQVTEVIDHHVGFEKYWQERIGQKAHIEFIGSACTQVYECWLSAGLLPKMSQLSARLLVCGILDNTLNFGAQVTTERDKSAYKALLRIADLPGDWTAQYFTQCQEAILKDPAKAAKNDTKLPIFQSFGGQICFGQLAVWDARSILSQHQQALTETLSGIKSEWFLNLISIEERKSYFVTDNASVQHWLAKLLGIEFKGSVAVADRLWLRKEVIKQEHLAKQF